MCTLMPNADVFGHHAHLMQFKRQMPGENILRHVRRLGAVIDGEPLVARIPVGDDGARLVGDAGMAAEHEGCFGDGVRFGEGRVGIARHMRALECEVVAEIEMDHRRRRIECGFSVGDGRQRLVVDLDQRAGVFRFGARSCHHRADRLALPAGARDRDGMLRRRFDAFEMREHAHPRRDHVRKLRAGNDGDHARRFLDLLGRDVFDARVRVRRAQESDMRHARQHDVADILPAPLRQSRQIRPRYRAADIGVRPVERSEARGLVGREFHLAPVIPGPSASEEPGIHIR
jgi:hypothetical protein